MAVAATGLNTLLMPDGFPGLEIRRCSGTSGPPPHFHAECQISLVEEGHGTFSFGRAVSAARADDLCVVAPHQVHQGVGAPPTGWRLTSLTLPWELVQASLADGHATGGAEQLRSHVVPRGKPTRLLRRHFRSFCYAVDSQSDRLEQESWLLLMLLQVVPPADAARLGPVRELPAVRRAADYLANCFAQAVSLDELADVACLSKYHLLRAFARHLGLPPHAYQQQLRLAAAKRRLQAGHSITETALALGFADQAHLTRLFRRFFDLTPHHYRKSAISFKN